MCGESITSPKQPHSWHSGQHKEHFGLFCICTAEGFGHSAPYLHTEVPLARCPVESWFVTLNPGASTASLQLEVMGSPQCELWPWIQHSWAGEHSSAWDSQLLKGHSSIIGALITLSMSLASFCSADSTGRPEGFAEPQRHQAAATW